jgi:DNA-binding response OmpR family regulator
VALILQVAYDPELGSSRGELLLQAGLRVVTVHDSVQAKAACDQQRFDAIVLGYAAPLPQRKTLFVWLREHCPGVPIVALFSDRFMPIPEADYSLHGEDPKNLVAVLRRVVREPGR